MTYFLSINVTGASSSDLLREINEGETRRWPLRRGRVLYEICMRTVIDCEKPRDRTCAKNIYFRRKMCRILSKELGTSKRFPEQIWSAISNFEMKKNVKNKEYILIFFAEDRIVFWLKNHKSNFININLRLIQKKKLIYI